MKKKTTPGFKGICVYLGGPGTPHRSDIWLGRPPGRGNKLSVGHQQSDPPLEVLTEGEGFSVYLFNNAERLAGFLEGMNVLREFRDDVSYAWKNYRDGRYAVAVTTPTQADQEWVDLTQPQGRPRKA